jgi:acyl-CoA thioesterase-1
MSEFLVQDGERVICVGDSITDAGRTGNAGPWGEGWVRQLRDLVTTSHPERRIDLINAGVSGNTVEDLTLRWTDDVIRRGPQWVLLGIGINDCVRTVTGNGGVAVDVYAVQLDALLARTRQETDARVLIVDPFYISDDDSPSSVRGIVLTRLAGYLAVTREAAARHDALHARVHEAFQKQLAYRPADYFAPEPIHPYSHGHTVIALTVLEALGWC